MRMIGNMLGVGDQAQSPEKKQPQDSTKSSDFNADVDQDLGVDLADIDEDKQNQSYVEEDEENQEEIDFDQLLGDAARTQVDYDEDRDDYDFEDDADNLTLSNTDQGALK